MKGRPTMYRLGLAALLGIASLIVTQPLGVFWHFVHDHLGEHAHAHDDGTMHVEAPDAVDHDADHHHVWTTPAATIETPRVSQLHVIAALGFSGDTRWPSTAPWPPFSPPRA